MFCLVALVQFAFDSWSLTIIVVMLKFDLLQA